ncbi:hypothetical protein WKW80_14530 [Variovorax humicola]|uniref:Uncharacterized protein n=1 Tax=Variovorax humicola TaxID=1769758 RepID=A0ABU8VZJ7_9BURK
MLEGELASHFYVTLIVGVFVVAFVQWRYRVVVLEGMLSVPGEVVAARAASAAQMQSTDAVEAGAAPEGRALAWERAMHRRVIAGWLVSVGLPSLVLAITYNASAGIAITLARIALEVGGYLCVVVPMVAVSLAWPWTRGALSCAVLLVAGAVATVLASLVQRALGTGAVSIDQLRGAVFFFQFAAVLLPIPMVLILGSGVSRIRGVMPITFAGLLIFGFAPFLGAHATNALAESRAGGALVLAGYGLLGHWASHATFVILALPVGWLAWRRLHALARAYEAKRFSDVQLLGRAWWLMFVAVQATTVGASEHPFWGLAGCAMAYWMFVFVNNRVFQWLHVARDSPPPRTLLLLRVFGHAARTGRLFDRIGARWRYFGPVTVIAAPDVVARTIDPGDYLHYMLGTVDETFVRSGADLQRRLAAHDEERDPDGRFRVNEFCCADTTWQATVVELMARAEVVLMDLRGISRERLGCEYELRQLAAFVLPRRVVLVVDGTTDAALVRGMLGAAAGGVTFRDVGNSRVVRTDPLFIDLLRAAR